MHNRAESLESKLGSRVIPRLTHPPMQSSLKYPPIVDISHEKYPNAIMQQNLEGFELGNCLSPATNESYSVDRIALEISNRTTCMNNIPSPTSQMWNNNSEQCESSMRFNFEEMNFIEYEEFHPEKPQPSARGRVSEASSSSRHEELDPESIDMKVEDKDVCKTARTNTNSVLDHSVMEFTEWPQARTEMQSVECMTDRSDRPLPSQRHTHKRFLFGVPNLSQNGELRGSTKSVSSKSSGSNKNKRDCCELPLQETQSRFHVNNVSTSFHDVSKDGRLTQTEETSRKSSVQEVYDMKLDSENARFRFRASAKPTEDSIIVELQEKLLQKDREIDRLMAQGKQQQRPTVKVERGTNTSSPYKARESQAMEKSLSEFNRELREELAQAYVLQQQLQSDNRTLKADVAEHKEMIFRLQERKVKTDTAEFALQKEIRAKEAEISDLLENQKNLQTKKMKLKSIVKQKDEIILDLKSQIEELSRSNQNEVHISMVEKTKIYRDKISELCKQLDAQKDIVKQKETAIDSLLLKLDSLADSNQNKTKQITTLNNEIKLLKETQVSGVRRDSKQSPSICHSHKSSTDAVVSQTKDSRELKPALPIKKSDSQEAEGKGRDISQKKRSSDQFIQEKRMLSSTMGRNMFSSTDWTGKSTDEITKSLNHNDSRDSDTPNIRTCTPDPEEPSKKKIAQKSSESGLRTKNETEKELQNIEDIQKRLAYLKSKRMEFEKRKYQALSIGREESLERRKDENLFATQTFTNLKSLSTNMQGSISSPLMSGKKRKDICVKDKENILSRYNNYFHIDESANPTHEPFSKTQLTLTEENHSRKSSKTRPPKVDQNQFNKTDYVNVRTATRYASSSNHHTAAKNDPPSTYVKGHKKSYDANIKPKDLFKLTESPSTTAASKGPIERNRSSSRQKEMRDYLYKGSLTPSSHGQQHSKPFEKHHPETKLRK